MDEEPTEPWVTGDLTVAAYLRAVGIRYVDMTAENGECVWTFERNPELTAELGKYHMGEGRVEPEEFSRQLLKLRRRMFDVLDGAAQPSTGTYGRIQ